MLSKTVFKNLKLNLGFSFTGPMIEIQNLLIYQVFDVEPLRKVDDL